MWFSTFPVVLNAPWCPENIIQAALLCPDWRCVSDLMPIPITEESCSVVHSCTLSGHGPQLLGELVLGSVFGDGGVALDGWAAVSVSIIMCVLYPLQYPPWGLVDPVPAVTSGDRITGGCVYSEDDVRDSPVLGLTPAAASWTGHLRTRKISPYQ